jgi:hypothetical protein
VQSTLRSVDSNFAIERVSLETKQCSSESVRQEYCEISTNGAEREEKRKHTNELKDGGTQKVILSAARVIKEIQSQLKLFE